MGDPRTFEFGPFRLDAGRRLLTRDGEPVLLAPKPIALLLHLLERPGQTLSKEELIRHLWEDSVGSEANLSVNVAAVRRALGERPRDHRYVVTVPMKGYAFVAEVRTVGGESPAVTGPAESGRTRPRRLAILPFQNPHPEFDDEHLGVGLADAITEHIPHLPEWAVQSPPTVRRLAADGLDPRTAGRELEADVVLTGVIGRVAGLRTLSAHLISVEDGSVLWGDTYTETEEGLLRLPRRIAEDLVRMVGGHRDDTAESDSHLRYPKSQEAFEECLKGRFLVERAGGESLLAGIEHFRRAQELDPEYSLAHAGEAGAIFKLWRLGQMPSAIAAPQIEAAARRAVELDAALADPYFWLANLNLVHHWNWEAARTQFGRGLRIAPNSSLGRTLHGYYLALADRPDEALAEARFGQSLEPTNLFANSTIGNILRVTGQVEAAVSQFQTVLRMAPNFLWGHLLGGWTMLAAEMYDEAREEYEMVRRVAGDIPWVLAGLAYVRARTGEMETARGLVEKLTETSASGHVEPFILAFAHLGLDDREGTLRWLEKAYLERNPVLVYQRLEPIWGSLHQDPEFKAIFDRIGSPAHWNPSEIPITD